MYPELLARFFCSFEGGKSFRAQVWAAGGPDWAIFSPIGWLFTLGSFFKKTGVTKVFGQFFRGTNYVLILADNGLGYILGTFFTNSS
jgi:hypothetical protein